MKVTKIALGSALAGFLLGGTAMAQQPAPTSRIQQTAFDYGDYYSQDPAPPAPAPTAPAAEEAPAVDAPATAGCSTGCNTGCGTCDTGCNTCCDSGCGCDWFQCCEHGEAWKLFDCCCCEDGFKVYGWVAQSFTWNPDNPADRFNGPVTFVDRANEYQLNQAYLIAEKAVDTGGCGTAWGGRVDLLYGTDYRFTLAEGLDAKDAVNNAGTALPRWNSDPRNFYGLAMPQLYAEFGYNDTKVKIGHFYTIIGYEVVPATGNFFVSHAYTMQYGEPFTHTGFLFSHKASDQVMLYAGMTRGWDNWNDPIGQGPSFLGGITLTSAEGNDSLAFALHTGNEIDANFVPQQDNGNRYIESIVYSHKFDDNNTYVLQSDYGNQNGVNGAQDAEWYGVNQYFFHTINQCWAWGARAEWFRDDDGFRVAPAGDYLGSNTASAGGFAGNFYEVTLGMNWKPNANWIVRPEVRWDWYSGPTNGNGDDPYDDGSSDHQFLAYFDVIFTY